MSTHSNIGIKDESGSIRVISCWNDGYPSYVGAVLKEHYTTVEKINKLIWLGSLIVLGEEPYTDPKISELSYPEREALGYKGCIAFKDRNEKLQEVSKINIYPNKEEWILDSSAYFSYAYLYEDGKWKYFSWDTKRWALLTDKVIKQED